jgi:hypothetical protein
MIQAIYNAHEFTILQDNDQFQGKFNSLIELNQADRGDLVRSPTREKLATFLAKLKDDPTGTFQLHTSTFFSPPLLVCLRWKHLLRTVSWKGIFNQKSHPRCFGPFLSSQPFGIFSLSMIQSFILLSHFYNGKQR